MRQTATDSPVSPRDKVRQRLRVGIIGFGQLAQGYYVPALRKKGVQLEICVADPLESSRAAAERAFAAVRTYPEYRQMLERESLDAVLVSTPPSQHLGIWRDVSLSGMPVFMEKPFLLAHELGQIDPSDRAWEKLMVNFNRRFWPAYRSLGQHVANGSLGQLRKAHFVLEVNPENWSRVSNHRARKGEGGVLYDLGSQVLDLVLWTFDTPTAEVLACRSAVDGPNEQVELKLALAGGLEVDCRLAYGRHGRESVRIEGDEAILQLRNPNFLCWCERNTSPTARLARGIVDLAVLGYRGIFRERSMLRYTVSAALADFFGKIGDPGPFSPGFGDALRVARCTSAAASLAGGRGRFEP